MAIDGVRLVPVPDLTVSHPAAHEGRARPADEWWTGSGVGQWNLSASAARVLRGMHLHGDYDEVYLLLAGVAEIGLCDLRPQSPSRGRRRSFTVRAPSPAVLVPRGVLHGVHFLAPGLLLIGRSCEYDGLDEWRCRWDDPDLHLAWSAAEPLLSADDAAAGRLDELVVAFERWQRRGRRT